MKRNCHKHAGFSLIEVALALLVVSVGLVAVVGMFPSGLDSGRKANEDTQSALFADYVLNTIRALASCTNNPIAMREMRWSDFDPSSTTIPIPVAAPDMWDSKTMGAKINPGDIKKNIVFASYEDKKIEEMSITYSFSIADIVAGRMRRAKLEIWPGYAGSTNNYHAYYTDIFRGDLK